MKIISISICLLVLAGVASAQAPVLFFTDLQSAPATGGEVNGAFAGAFVTLYGRNFGATQGSSSVVLVSSAGSTTVCNSASNNLRVVSWGSSWLSTSPVPLQRITVQLSGTCVTGNFQVITSAGSSNTLPFTVRTGSTIKFVGGNAGDFANINACRDQMNNPGDICYVRDGRNVTTDSGNGNALNLNLQAPAATPRAIIAYPGATVTIGTTALRAVNSCVNESICNGGGFGWLISGGGGDLTLRGGFEAFHLVGNETTQNRDHRLIGLRMDCPNVSGQDGCLETTAGANVTLLGIEATAAQNDTSGAYKQAHILYFSTSTDHVEVGWSWIHGIGTQGSGCWGIQFHSSDARRSGDTSNDFLAPNDQFDIKVHDNQITNTRCGALNLASVDPTLGAVLIYNNVFWHVGGGGGDTGNWNCMQMDSFSNSSGIVQVYNNTFRDCAFAGNSPTGDSGAIAFNSNGPALRVSFNNNIVDQVGPATFMSQTTATENGSTRIAGTNNIWNGANDIPTASLNALHVSPQFVSTVTPDFRPAPGSPAIGSGTTTITPPTYDLAGLIRPSPSSRGALEAAPSATVNAQFAVNPASGFVFTSMKACDTNPVSSCPTVSFNQAFVISNTGTGITDPMTISGISMTGSTSDFFLTDGSSVCGSVPLQPNGTPGLNTTRCIKTANFLPKTKGPKSINMVVSDNAPGNPHVVSISGVAIQGVASLSGSSINFGSSRVGVASSTQVLTVTNTGDATLVLQAFPVGGGISNTAEFSAVATTCGTLNSPSSFTLNSNISCTVTFQFTPSATGSRSSNYSIAFDSEPTFRVITFSGTGLNPAATLSPTSLTFAGQTVGSSSATQPIVLTSSGTSTLTVSSISISGTSFSQTNNCPATLVSGASCTILVKFTPLAAGALSGSLSVADDAANTPQTASLSGTGLAVSTSGSAYTGNVQFSGGVKIQ